MEIIVTGSLAFDQIMDFPGKFSDSIMPEKIHQINLSFLVNKLTKQRGGTAGNIAYNLALLGEKPIILAAAGYDFDDYKNELDKVGVNTLMIHIIRVKPTASAFIFTDQADNQITGFYPGAMKYSKKLSIKNVILRHQPKDLTRHPELVSGSVGDSSPSAQNDTMVVISPNDPLAMMNFVKECLKYKIPYMFDPGMQLPRLSDQDLKLGIEGAKIVIGNDYEMALMKKRLKAAKELAADQIRITTLGEKGAKIEVRDTIYSIPPALPKQVLDPTGAGDAWRAGFLAGILTGQSLDVCGRMGSVASVYTVEKYGTQTHQFTIDQFKKRYKENFGKNSKSEARNPKPSFALMSYGRAKQFLNLLRRP